MIPCIGFSRVRVIYRGISTVDEDAEDAEDQLTIGGLKLTAEIDTEHIAEAFGVENRVEKMDTEETDVPDGTLMFRVSDARRELPLGLTLEPDKLDTQVMVFPNGNIAIQFESPVETPLATLLKTADCFAKGIVAEAGIDAVTVSDVSRDIGPLHPVIGRLDDVVDTVQGEVQQGEMQVPDGVVSPEGSPVDVLYSDWSDYGVALHSDGDDSDVSVLSTADAEDKEALNEGVFDDCFTELTEVFCEKYQSEALEQYRLWDELLGAGWEAPFVYKYGESGETFLETWEEQLLCPIQLMEKVEPGKYPLSEKGVLDMVRDWALTVAWAYYPLATPWQEESELGAVYQTFDASNENDVALPDYDQWELILGLQATDVMLSREVERLGELSINTDYSTVSPSPTAGERWQVAYNNNGGEMMQLEIELCGKDNYDDVIAELPEASTAYPDVRLGDPFVDEVWYGCVKSINGTPVGGAENRIRAGSAAPSPMMNNGDGDDHDPIHILVTESMLRSGDVVETPVNV